MGRDQADPKDWTGEHHGHRVLFLSRPSREVFGLSAKRHSGRGHGFFARRRGDKRPSSAVLHSGDRGIEGRELGAPSLDGRSARLHHFVRPGGAGHRGDSFPIVRRSCDLPKLEAGRRSLSRQPCRIAKQDRRNVAERLKRSK